VPITGIGDQLDLAGLAGLEPHRGAGRDVEAETASLVALEIQRPVGLEEVVVRTDLDRPVAGVGHLQLDGLAPAFSSISPSAAMTSPGIIEVSPGFGIRR
jgi:hypothetical protein